MTELLNRRRLIAAAAACGVAGAPVSLAARVLPRGDSILVMKGERKLYLQRGGQTIGWYWMALGRYPVGPKIQHRDSRTPEGIYTVTGRSTRTNFHRTLYLSYPNALDRERAGLLRVNPGGGIAIHGVPPGFGPYGKGERMMDWTDGCIALTNADIDELWERVPDGVVVDIRP